MDSGSYRENLEGLEIVVMGEGIFMYLFLSFWDGGIRSVILFVGMFKDFVVC